MKYVVGVAVMEDDLIVFIHPEAPVGGAVVLYSVLARVPLGVLVQDMVRAEDLKLKLNADKRCPECQNEPDRLCVFQSPLLQKLHETFEAFGKEQATYLVPLPVGATEH